MEIQPCGAVGIVFNENGVIISGLQEILQMVVPEAEGIGLDDGAFLGIDLSRN